MDDINFELADKLGYKRPKSPFRNNDLDFFKKAIEESEKFDNFKHLQLISNSGYKLAFLIFQNGTIEYYENKSNYIVENKIAYFYTTGSKLYFVCDTENFIISHKIREKQKAPFLIPETFSKQDNYYKIFEKFLNNNLEKLDADNRYVLDKTENDPSVIYADGNEFPVQKYIANPNGDKIPLIRFPDNLYIPKVNGSNFISHKLKDTNRRYVNPYLFSGYIGVLFELINSSIISTGSCFNDGTGFPSSEHTNGESIDISFDSKTNSITNLAAIEFAKIRAFKKFHFQKVVINEICKPQISKAGFLDSEITYDKKYHKDHFHFGNFNMSKVENKSKKLEELIGRKNYS